MATDKEKSVGGKEKKIDASNGKDKTNEKKSLPKKDEKYSVNQKENAEKRGKDKKKPK